MITEVYQKLLEKQDLEYQKFHSKLCPGTNNILGVRIPEIRKIVKNLLKENYLEYLENVQNDSYEETMIEGLLIAESKLSLEEKFIYMDKFIPKIDNWAICDTVVSSFHLKEQELESMWNYLMKYKDSKKEFEVRFLTVMLMSYYLIDEYMDRVLEIVDSIKLEDYYVKMAIAWLISMLYVKDKKKTLKYLNKNHLTSWTYQKALQKIIESNRVSKEEKKMIRNMKSKK